MTTNVLTDFSVQIILTARQLSARKASDVPFYSHGEGKAHDSCLFLSLYVMAHAEISDGTALHRLIKMQ
jgi:hypothetical protein